MIDQQGQRYPTPEERADRAEQQLEQERQRTEDLLLRLRKRGIDINEL